MATYEVVTNPEEYALVLSSFYAGSTTSGYSIRFESQGGSTVAFIRKLIAGGVTPPTWSGPETSLLDSRLDAVEAPGSVTRARLAGDVVTFVNDVLADNATVVNAAATAAVTAVDAEIAGRPILEGADIIEPEIAFAVVDQDGRRTWIEAAITGGLTQHAADKIGEFINGATSLLSVNDLAFAIVDQDERRTWIEAGNDGKPTPRSLALINEGLAVGGIAAGSYIGSDGGTYPISSGPGIACSGDSLTAGAGGTPYPSALATLTGRSVINLGVGGENTPTIAGRAGGRPWLATVSGGSIPASGGVTVTLAPDDTGTVAPLVQGASSLPVTIAGVAGTLSLSAGVYTFARTASGLAVAVLRPAAVMSTAWIDRRADIFVMWWGQNDDADTATVDRIINRMRHTAHALTPADKRWLTMSRPTGTASFNAANESTHLLAFGRRYINIREYLASYAALSEAGITPTAQDDTDISTGTVPTSLRVDAVHLNTSGYSLVANAVFGRMKELGWM